MPSLQKEKELEQVKVWSPVTVAGLFKLLQTLPIYQTAEAIL